MRQPGACLRSVELPGKAFALGVGSGRAVVPSAGNLVALFDLAALVSGQHQSPEVRESPLKQQLRAARVFHGGQGEQGRPVVHCAAPTLPQAPTMRRPLTVHTQRAEGRGRRSCRPTDGHAPPGASVSSPCHTYRVLGSGTHRAS